MEFCYMQHRRRRELIRCSEPIKERAAEPGAMMEFRKLYAAREAESSMETARDEYEEELGKGTGWTFAIMRKKGNPAKEKWICSVREGIFHIPDKPPKKQFLNGTTSGDAAGATSRLPQQQEVRPQRRANVDEGEQPRFLWLLVRGGGTGPKL
ncbi:unnamed protein product [Calypogeia fissa]